MISTSATPADDDWLEQPLHAHAVLQRGDYIVDAGFTARVMTALPPAEEPAPAWRRPAVAVLWTVAGAGAFVVLPDAALEVGREAFRLLATRPVSLPQIGMTLAALGAATWAAAAWALRSD